MQVIRDLTPLQKESAVALGSFDGLHLGHQSVIKAALHAKPLLPAVFTFEKNPLLSLKKEGPPLLMENETKLMLLSQMGVEAVYLVDFPEIASLSPECFFREILLGVCCAKKICCGFNFRFGKNGAGDAELLAELCRKAGILCEISGEVRENGEAVSSSRIREALLQGDVKGAERMLGRRFFYDFTVVHGRSLGRLMGTPTINQNFPEGFILPKFGVYASLVRIGTEKKYAVTNIGVKPTVGSDRAVSETWIPDFDGDLYGEKICVELIDFLRPEQKFSGIEELRAAIRSDGLRAKKIAEKLLK